MQSRTPSPLAASLLSVLILSVVTVATGCRVNVTDAGTDGRKAVDIESPLGDLSVRTNVEAPDTGLPLYPGATPLRDGHEPENAKVSIESVGLGLDVNAAKYAGGGSQEATLAFYRKALAGYGPVTECHGHVEFEGPRGSKRPMCERRPGSREVQLIAGTEDDFRMVSVKPRGDGAEFAVVHIRMNARS